MFLLISLSFLYLGCQAEESLPQTIRPEQLYRTFEYAGKLSSRRARDANSVGCGYWEGFENPRVKYEFVLNTFMGDVGDAFTRPEILDSTRLALLGFVSSVDSLIEKVNPEISEHLILAPTLPKELRSSLTGSALDTTILLMEATRVILIATSMLVGGTKICGWGSDRPYVVVSPITKSDSFSVRVGLRLPDYCPSSGSYAVVLQDTLFYTGSAWADGTFHRDHLGGLDSLWVESCLVNPLTGIRSCWDVGVGVGW